MIDRRIGTPIMHRAVVHAGTVYLGGIVAENITVGPREQMAQILETMDGYLRQVGSDREHVLSATIYLTDIGHKPETDAAWKHFFAPAHFPARATVEVSSLGDAAILVELSVTAACIAARRE